MPFDLIDPMSWVLGSFAVAVVAANAAWAAARLWRRRRAPSPVWLPHALEPLVWLLTALFFLLPPVAAWRAGALSPYWMGLTETDWVETAFSGGLLAAAIMAIPVFGWLVYRHGLAGRTRTRGMVHPLLAPLDAALLQWHWAFYRAGVIGWLSMLAHRNLTWPASMVTPLGELPFYWGSWLGMVLVGVEWALNPFARRVLTGARKDPASAPAAERTVIRMGLAVSTTALFILTRNFWLAVVCHVVVETAIVAFLPAPSAQTAEEQRRA
jgi:hypothetical protein